MFGIESMLLENNFSPKELMAIGYLGLLLVTLLAMVVLEVRNHDLAANDIPKFIKPALLYSSFLLGLELFGMTMNISPLARDLVASLQFGGYAAVMFKCFRTFFSTLQKLGLDMKEYDRVLLEKEQELNLTPAVEVLPEATAGFSEEETHDGSK